MRILLSLFIFILLIISCSSPKESADNNLSFENNETPPLSSISIDDMSGPNILFVIYEVALNDRNKMEATVYKQSIGKGKLKNRKPKPVTKEDIFTIELLDTSGQIIQTVEVDNPLEGIVNYPNEDGTSSEKEITYPKKEIVFRTQIEGTESLVRLKYQNNTLHTLKIN